MKIINLLILVMLFSSCGKLNDLYNQLKKAETYINNLNGSIGIDGKLSFDSLTIDFQQITVGTIVNKKIHINNSYIDNLTIPVDSNLIISPLSISSNTCTNVKINDSCDIILTLDTSNLQTGLINQIINIYGIDIKIIGNILSNPNVLLPSTTTAQSIIINPINETIEYGNLRKNVRYVSNFYLTNISKMDFPVMIKMNEDIEGITVNSCVNNEIIAGKTCQIQLLIDTNQLSYGQYEIELIINEISKKIKFNVAAFRRIIIK